MSQDDRGSEEQSHSQEQDEQKEWQRFLSLLRIALAKYRRQLHIVLTLRSDFEPRFLNSALKTHWKNARFPVRAMNSNELRDAIEGPALKQALYFEPSELMGKLIDEVGQMPGALPLLSFTLSELYIKLYERWTKDKSTDRALRIEDYEELGGVAGALTHRATEEYESLEDNQHKATMRRVMLRMVTLEGGESARRRVLCSELVYPNQEENQRVDIVIQQLVTARLLVKGHQDGKAYVEPAHDYLVRGWDLMQKWKNQKLENLILQQRLTPQANDWANDRQNTGLLIPDGDRLNSLKKILESSDVWFNQQEKEFVENSIGYIEIQQELDKERLVRAELKGDVANVKKAIQDHPLEGLLRATKAMRRNIQELPEELLDSIKENLLYAMKTVRVLKTLEAHKGAVNSVAFSQDGHKIATGGRDHIVRLWDSEGNKIYEHDAHNEHEKHKNFVTSVAFSRDGQMVVSGGEDGNICLWNLQSETFKTFSKKHEGEYVKSVAFSPDGKTIVSGGRDNTVRLWNLQGEQIGKTFRHKDSVNSVAFAPNGELIASGSNDQTVCLLDNQGNLILRIDRAHEGKVSSVVFSPCGNMIASGGEDNTVRLWDLDGKPIINNPFKHEERVTSVTFSTDGQVIVSGTRDKKLYLWDLKGNPIGQPWLGHEAEVRSVAFCPVSKRIISGDKDGILHFWDVRGVWDEQGNLIEQSPTGDDKNKHLYGDSWKLWFDVCRERLQLELDYPFGIDIDSLYKRGKVKFKRKMANYDFRKADLRAAIEIFSLIIQLDNEYANAYCYRGLAYVELGNKQLAAADLRRSVDLCRIPEQEMAVEALRGLE